MQAMAYIYVWGVIWAVAAFIKFLINLQRVALDKPRNLCAPPDLSVLSVRLITY